MRALPLPLALAACAASQGGSGPSDYEQAIAGRTPGTPQACVAANDATTLRVLDAHTLGYESGGTMWVNRLPRYCPALRPTDAIAIEMHGREYCRDDRFRTITPGMTIPGPVCSLGDFVPYRRAR